MAEGVDCTGFCGVPPQDLPEDQAIYFLNCYPPPRIAFSQNKLLDRVYVPSPGKDHTHWLFIARGQSFDPLVSI